MKQVKRNEFDQKKFNFLYFAGGVNRRRFLELSGAIAGAAVLGAAVPDIDPDTKLELGDSFVSNATESVVDGVEVVLTSPGEMAENHIPTEVAKRYAGDSVNSGVDVMVGGLAGAVVGRGVVETFTRRDRTPKSTADHGEVRIITGPLSWAMDRSAGLCRSVLNQIAHNGAAFISGDSKRTFKDTT